MPYLIDGNNLLGSWGGPRGQDDRRAEVVRRVAAFCRAQGRARDARLRRPSAARRHGGAGPGPAHPARAARRASDADTVIRELVERAAAPGGLIVVTSDKALYSYVRTLGAAVLRAHEWNALERPRCRAGRETVGQAGARRRRRGLAEAVRRRRTDSRRRPCDAREPFRAADKPA